MRVVLNSMQKTGDSVVPVGDFNAKKKRTNTLLDALLKYGRCVFGVAGVGRIKVLQRHAQDSHLMV